MHDENESERPNPQADLRSNLRLIVENEDISLRRVALFSGLSVATLSRFMRGKSLTTDNYFTLAAWADEMMSDDGTCSPKCPYRRRAVEAESRLRLVRKALAR